RVVERARQRAKCPLEASQARGMIGARGQHTTERMNRFFRCRPASEQQPAELEQSKSAARLIGGGAQLRLQKREGRGHGAKRRESSSRGDGSERRRRDGVRRSVFCQRAVDVALEYF